MHEREVCYTAEREISVTLLPFSTWVRKNARKRTSLGPRGAGASRGYSCSALRISLRSEEVSPGDEEYC
jgi:hypothetical protein